MIPRELKYTKEHEWVRIEGGEAVFGITDHAQEQLGDITFVELPNVGKEVKKSESFALVESVKAASDVYAPISGKIISLNAKLKDNPELINQSPYEDGWICRASITNAKETTSLMDAAAYEEYLGEKK